jgi:formamidopyrimidine-DNA glycosylase
MALEYPEIKKISDQLKQVLPGNKFIDIELGDLSDYLVNKHFVNLHRVDIVGLSIKEVSSWGLNIFIQLNKNLNLIFGHLNGKILYHPSNDELINKSKILFYLSDHKYLTFHTRFYGFACALNNREINKHKYLNKNGVEPLSDEFTYEYFETILNNLHNKVIKKLQSSYEYLTGYQNGYFQDIFFDAGILPLRKISSLNEEEKYNLYQTIHKITLKATQNGGASTERDIYNKPGKYKRKIGLNVKNQPCPKCGAPIFSKNILGSNSYFCPNCQH